MLKSIGSLKNVKVLDKAAQKKISGGIDDSGSGGVVCYAQNANGGVDAYMNYSSFGATLNAAAAGAAASGGHYCCSSCASASWMRGYLN